MLGEQSLNINVSNDDGQHPFWGDNLPLWLWLIFHGGRGGNMALHQEQGPRGNPVKRGQQ